MTLEIQTIFDTVSSILLYALPFSIILSLLAKITNIFQSFVFGKEVKL